jgi:hypothetical protein
MHATSPAPETGVVARILLAVGCLFLAAWAVRGVWLTGVLVVRSEPLHALTADPRDTQNRTGDVFQRTVASLAGDPSVSTVHLLWQHPRDHVLGGYFATTFWLFPARVVELSQAPELIIAVTAADEAPVPAGYREDRVELEGDVRVAVLRRTE